MNPISRLRVLPRGWLLAVPILLLAACGPRGGSGGSRLDGAIGKFVAGDYAGAVRNLEALAGELENESDLRELYLYLGRAYLELGEYSRAVDAFAAGAAHGGGAPFDAYLARLKAVVEGDPDALLRLPTVSRGRLMMTIERLFFRDVGSGAGGYEQSETLRRGIVPLLADGSVHADAEVTRASFYSTVCRLVRVVGIERTPTSFFPDGPRWAQPAGARVTGTEAVEILRKVEAARGEARGG